MPRYGEYSGGSSHIGETIGCRANCGGVGKGVRVVVGSRAGGGADDGSWLEYSS